MTKIDANASTFDDLMAGSERAVVPIAQRLRKIIQDTHPECVEAIHLGYSSASYGVGPKKNSEAYCYIMPQKERVNLGFYYGVDLADPDGLLEGTGKQLRHAKVQTVDDAERPAIRQLIQAALQERKTSLRL